MTAGDESRATRKGDPTNPFIGTRGFFNRLNRVVYTFTGPAQVGVGRLEESPVPTADPRCPLCDLPMDKHQIERAKKGTRLHCPAAA